ncbi:DUF1217 domain-containing protein [Microvirga solisilvae]|uniref:DUF1217 domain-containing protein n=1 Tax=Microvirga solisilvae TaxID=2919498 RepID=UPI001FAEB670|nr:DUF1217 domain-containing protein [Microvirga solisilvae]
MVSTATRYQIISTNMARTKTQIQNDPIVKRETDYYNATIKTIKTVDDFVKNDRVFKYAMKAYGLEDMAYAKAFMKKMLNEGVASPLSMANKMTNPLYKAFARAFDFVGKGAAATSAASATTETVQKYIQQTLETQEGRANQGVQLALYFKRKASSVTKPMEILADRALLKFMQTTFSIPEASSRADLDIQVRNLEKVLNVKDFQDPKKVDKLIQRFSAMWDMNNAAPETIAPVLSLFNQSTEQGVSVDLMMSIAKLRLGGW